MLPRFHLPTFIARTIRPVAEALTKAPRRIYPGRWRNHGRYGEQKEQWITFEQMRLSYLRSEVIRACVDTILVEASTAEWDIVPVHEDDEDLKQEAKQGAIAWARQNAVTDLRTIKRQARQRFKQAKSEQSARALAVKKLLSAPNPDDDFNAFFLKVAKDILVMDAGGIEKERSLSGGIAALWPMDGATISIETDETGQVLGFWQGEGTPDAQHFDRQDLIYLLQNPSTYTVYGTSPIETVWQSVAGDLFANQYNSKYFEKHGVPSGLLSLLGVKSEDEFIRFMRDWERVLKENPHNIPVIWAQDAKFTSLSGNNRDMQFLEYLSYLIKRICMVYRVTPSELGFTDSSMSGLGSTTASQQADIFESKAIAPLLHLFARKLTKELVWDEFGFKDLQFKFIAKDTAAEDRQRAQEAEDLKNSLTCINEIRATRGQKPVPWGWTPLVGLNNWVAGPQNDQGQKLQGHEAMPQADPPGLPPAGAGPHEAEAGPDLGERPASIAPQDLHREMLSAAAGSNRQLPIVTEPDARPDDTQRLLAHARLPDHEPVQDPRAQEQMHQVDGGQATPEQVLATMTQDGPDEAAADQGEPGGLNQPAKFIQQLIGHGRPLGKAAGAAPADGKYVEVEIELGGE